MRGNKLLGAFWKRWNKYHNNDDEENYSRKGHTKKIDDLNESITCCGLYYSLLPSSDIRFNIFYSRCEIQGRLMTYLRFLYWKSTGFSEWTQCYIKWILG